MTHVKPVESQPFLLKKALTYIDERAKSDQPFFLYFPMCPPHEPLVPAPEFVGKSDAQDLVRKSPQYGDWLYQGDAMLGQILEALERNGIADRTLVIATSDNGAERRAYEPLRDSKRSIYEGGHRVPFVARWPGNRFRLRLRTRPENRAASRAARMSSETAALRMSSFSATVPFQRCEER